VLQSILTHYNSRVLSDLPAFSKFDLVLLISCLHSIKETPQSPPGARGGGGFKSQSLSDTDILPHKGKDFAITEEVALCHPT